MGYAVVHETIPVVTIGLIAGLLTALCYGVASILQSGAATSSPRTAGEVSGKGIVTVVTKLPYLLGLAIDGVGFILGLVAVQYLPLFLAESLFAASVGVTAVLAVIFLKLSLTRMEIIALVGLMFGLMLLAISARPDQAKPIPDWADWLLLGIAVLSALAAVVVPKLSEHRLGPALALVAGLAYAGVGVSARELRVPDPWWMLPTEPLVWAIIIFGVVGTAMFAAALQHSAVTTVSAIVFGLETTLPAVVGLLFLGDEARHGFFAVALLGFVICLMSAIALANKGELPEAGSDEAVGDLEPAAE